MSAIQFYELPRKYDARQIGPGYRMIGFLKNGAAASTLNSRLRQPIAPIVLPNGFNTYRWWAKKSAALDAYLTFGQSLVGLYGPVNSTSGNPGECEIGFANLKIIGSVVRE
jgi:hypothetical protein